MYAKLEARRLRNKGSFIHELPDLLKLLLSESPLVLVQKL